MSEWSDYRWMVRTMAKDNGVTLISIARHCGVSNRKLNQILQAGPSKEQEELIAEALGAQGVTLRKSTGKWASYQTSTGGQWYENLHRRTNDGLRKLQPSDV